MSFLKMIVEFFIKVFGSKNEDHLEERKGADKPGQKLLWCPFAEKAPPMRTKGVYPKGYPEGAVIHWTSGSSASSSMEYGKNQGYNFWMIDKAGKVYQPSPLNEWGYHAGDSSWPTLGQSVSKKLVGIEIDCCGGLQKKSDGSYKSWFGRSIDADKVRVSGKNANIAAGAYEMFTKEQEDSLEHLLLWLKSNNPEVFRLENVLGHDEVSPGRKTDPGASLSMSMPEFREKLKKARLALA